MRPKTYQSYSHETKRAIVESKNVKLFPELKIPRSTAHHWIRHGINEAHSSYDHSQRLSFQEEKFNEMLTVLSNIISILLEIAPKMILESKLKEIAEFSKELCYSIEGDYKKILAKKITNKIFLPNSCESSSDGACLQKNPSQLTKREVSTMKRLVEAKKYAHFSISSLCLYAKRENIVHACVDTWYRYINKFEWQRVYKSHKSPKRKMIGIRASRPNQIWHIDATELKTTHGKKYYLQMIVDNFSRFIVAWKITKYINAENTANLIAKRQNQILTSKKKLN